VTAASKTHTGSYAWGIATISISEFLFALCTIWIRYELKRLQQMRAAEAAATTPSSSTALNAANSAAQQRTPVATLYTDAIREGVQGSTA
jgi:hypothetical protein